MAGRCKVCMLLDVLPSTSTPCLAAITALVLKWDIQWVYSLILVEEFIKAPGYKEFAARSG